MRLPLQQTPGCCQVEDLTGLKTSKNMLLDNDLLLWLVVSQVERPDSNEEDLAAMEISKHE
ncbi:MAG: hypothetical protein HWD62_02945 [Cyclobacteriaceae bacterium]|nr:MAG: hypothetical protein HWD62_02945 [Cyclobacteriaceae bacterium]